MRTNGESKLSFLLIGLGLGAIGGLMFALLARKETRKYLREQSDKGLDILNQRAGRLRASAEGILHKGREFMSRPCYDSVNTAKESEKQIYEQERRDRLGG